MLCLKISRDEVNEIITKAIDAESREYKNHQDHAGCTHVPLKIWTATSGKSFLWINACRKDNTSITCLLHAPGAGIILWAHRYGFHLSDICT